MGEKCGLQMEKVGSVLVIVEAGSWMNGAGGLYFHEYLNIYVTTGF